MNGEPRTAAEPRENVTSATYVKVIAVEAAIIVLLYIFGRLFT